MEKIRKAFMWFWLLSKRLYKKATFLVIMALIPILVFGYSMVADDESGIVTVALAKEDEDALAEQIIAELRQNSRLIRFIDCEAPEDAEALVIAGKADSAWIFPSNMQACIDRFVESGSERDAFVRVIERESTVPLMLAREKLGGILFKYSSETFYLSYARENAADLDSLSDEQLLGYYDGVNAADELFAFSYLDPAQSTEDASTGYLMAPVRGLLAVVITLCGLATAMYYIHDKNAGTFAWIAEKKLPFTEFGCQMISILNVSVVVLITLTAVGMTTSFGRELLALALYALCTAAFCMMIRRLCVNLRVLGTLLPLLIIAMLVICPVFFDLGALRELQYLLPPTYYINAIYNDKYLLYMAVYTLAASTIYFLSGKLLKRR